MDSILTNKMERLLSKAAFWEEASATVMYLGFAGPRTTGTDSATWLIAKIEFTDASQTAGTMKYPNGLPAYNQILDDRATLTYLFER